MTEASRRSGLSGNALKVIAIIAMTIDHVAWIGIYNYAQAETLPQILVHCIGRLTAPIMFFFVAVAFFIFHSRIYGMVHMACWLAVPLLSMYNGQRGKARWLGRFFYWYYPVHMALIGLIVRLFPLGQ